MADEAKSLDQSISEAVETGDTEETQLETPTEEVEEESEDTEDADEEENSDESSEEEDSEDSADVFSTDLSNEDLARAEQIYKQLNGPDAVEYFKFLAGRAGYELVEKATDKKSSTEGAAEQGELDSLLLEVLGDNYKFLDSKVINAIKAYDKVVSKRFEDREKKSATEEATSVIKTRLESFGKKHNLSFEEGKGDDVTEAMNTIAKKLPFTGKSIEDFDEYLSVIHTAAVAKVGKTADRVRKINKINKNLGDAETASVSAGDKGTRRGPARPTLDEALQAAIGSDGIFEE